MNTVTVEQQQLLVVPRGLSRLWSFRRRLEIPLEHVRGATVDPEAATEPKGLRVPGLSIPGRTAGTFRRDGETTFWNVGRGSDALVIELRDEPFQRLVLTVDDPRGVAHAVNDAASV